MSNGTSFGNILAAIRQYVFSLNAHCNPQDMEMGTPSEFSHFAMSTGPMANVDGTPMLNDFIDVAGKAYGDSGSSFDHDFGCSLSDVGIDSSGMDGSSW